MACPIPYMFCVSPAISPCRTWGHVSLWECWCFIAYMQGCQNGYELGIGFFHFVIVRGGKNVKRIENQIGIFLSCELDCDFL